MDEKTASKKLKLTENNRDNNNIINNNKNNNNNSGNKIFFYKHKESEIIREINIFAINDSITEVVNVYSIFEKYYYSHDIRLNSAIYLVEYHKERYPPYINLDSYIKFLTELFFEERTDIFNLFSTVNLYESNKPIHLMENEKNSTIQIVQNLFNNITSDKRFKNFFTECENTNKITLFQDKFRILKKLDTRDQLFFDKKEWVETNSKDHHLTIFQKLLGSKNKQLENSDVSNNNSDIGSSISDINNKDSIKSNNRNDNSINNNNNDDGNKIIKLSDILINEIINHTIKDGNNPINYNFYKVNQDNFYQIDLNQVGNYAMVSKQFFKVVKNYFSKNKVNYKWTNSSIKLNGNELNIISEPPTTFYYESINLIPLNYGLKKLNFLFSRIETLYIETFEYQRDGGHPNYNFQILDNIFYSFLPAMFSLKNIKVRKFCNSDSICLLLSSLSLPNKIAPNSIESFSIEFCGDEVTDTSFFSNLLKYHSNSLRQLNLSFYVPDVSLIWFYAIIKIIGEYLNNLKHCEIRLFSRKYEGNEDEIPLSGWLNYLKITDKSFYVPLSDRRSSKRIINSILQAKNKTTDPEIFLDYNFYSEEDSDSNSNSDNELMYNDLYDSNSDSNSDSDSDSDSDYPTLSNFFKAQLLNNILANHILYNDDDDDDNNEELDDEEFDYDNEDSDEV